MNQRNKLGDPNRAYGSQTYNNLYSRPSISLSFLSRPQRIPHKALGWTPPEVDAPTLHVGQVVLFGLFAPASKYTGIAILQKLATSLITSEQLSGVVLARIIPISINELPKS